MVLFKFILIPFLFLSFFSNAKVNDCNSPTAAVVGNNIIPANDGFEHWYSFTMPTNANGKKIIITSNATNFVVIYNSTNCQYLNDIASSNHGNLVASELSPGQTILILWGHSNAVDFEWNLSLGDIVDGDGPSSADIASTGQNEIVTNQKASYWYKFNMPAEAGKHLVINSSITTKVTILKELNGNYYLPLVSGNGSVKSVFLNANEQIYIRWDNFNGESFDWDLSIEDALPGEDCSIPLTAVEGINQVASSPEIGERWFKFVMPNVDKKVLMTLSNNYGFNVYNNCSDQNARVNSNQIVLPDLIPGQVIYISVGVQSTSIDLTVSLEDLDDGDKCQLAKQAVEGANNVALLRQVDYWYKYTTPNIQGKRLVISSTSSAAVSLYTNTCDNLINKMSATGSIVWDNLPANESIYIKWYNINNDASFTWNLSIDEGGPGEKCSTALTASLGDNLFPVTSKYGWIFYKFTMPDAVNKKLVIITPNPNNGFVIFNNLCDVDAPPIAYSTAGTTLGTNLLPNQEVTLAYYSLEGGNFTWNLSLEEIEPGDRCDLALTANEGLNELSDVKGLRWYTFTLPDVEAKKLTITSEASNRITVYKKNCPYLKELTSGYGKVIITDLIPLTQISIKWDLPPGTDFTWNLSIEDFEPGDSYSTATQIVEGINHLPQGNGTKYWYKFTMPDIPNQKLVITSPQWSYPVIYSSTLKFIETSYSNLPVTIIASTLTPGQEIFLAWDVGSYNNFDWNLSIEDIESGDNCGIAKIATVGSNQVPAGYPAEYWYTFTMPNESGKRLVITSETQNYVSIYSNCNTQSGSNWISSSYGRASAQLEANQQIYIKWSNSDGQGFSWNLATDNEKQGLNCANAQVANEGVNIVSGPPPSNYMLWYSFTMPNESGKKLVISSSSSNRVGLYYHSCDDVSSYDGGTGTVIGGLQTRYFLRPNQQVFISWDVYNDPNFSWNLSVQDLEPGEACSSTKSALIGNNYLPTLKKYSSYWYSFKMPSTTGKKLVITSDVEEIVVVYTGNCNNLNFIDFKNEGRYTLTGLQPDEMVYIEWSGYKAQGNFVWKLAVEDEQPGESCINPLAATLGSNTTQNAPHWFTYMIPKDGDYKISSVGLTTIDTYLSIYNGCNGILLGQNDDFKALQSEVTLSGLHNGEVIYIQWENNYQNNSTEGFIWQISGPKLDQTISFESIADKTIGDPSFDLSAISSAGLQVTFSSSSDKVSISDNHVSILTAGLVKIKGDQIGDLLYDPAPSVEQNFCINPIKPVISSVTTAGKIVLTSNESLGNQWFKEGELIEGATESSIEVTKKGLYTVIVTIDQCSSVVSDTEAVIITGDIEIANDEIKMYPNPVSEDLTIEIGQNQFGSVKIIDVLGRVTMTSEGSGQIFMKVSELSPGSYIILVKRENVISASKLIKK